VNELFQQLTETFHDYRIPPAFFGPFQDVSYEGLGGTYTEATDDAVLEINVGEEFGHRKFQTMAQ
jgi:hypothetical protein